MTTAPRPVNELEPGDEYLVRVNRRGVGFGETLFRDVPVGSRFSFADGGPLYERTKGGYRNGSGSRTYRTGARTLVFVRAPAEASDAGPCLACGAYDGAHDSGCTLEAAQS